MTKDRNEVEEAIYHLVRRLIVTHPDRHLHRAKLRLWLDAHSDDVPYHIWWELTPDELAAELAIRADADEVAGESDEERTARWVGLITKVVNAGLQYPYLRGYKPAKEGR